MRFLMLVFLVGCGFHASDVLTPAWEATVEACRTKQLQAIEDSESREEAELRVARIRAKCDQAYEGLRASGTLLDLTIGDGDSNRSE